jgi:hypothetical protein
MFFVKDKVINAHPHSSKDSNASLKEKKNGRGKNWSMFLNSKHFGVRRACWSFGMRTRTSNKQVNYKQKPAQTKQQVDKCVVVAILVHEQTTSTHGLTTLIMAQTWGKPPPSPL